MTTAQNRVALITGAGTGIGKAAAKALLQGGYQVVLAGRNLDKLEKAITDIGGNSENCLAVGCDVGKPEDVKHLFESLKVKFGRIDVLFNNAGIGAPAIPMEDLSYEQWTSVVNANLTGAFLCSQAAIRMMKDQTPQGGRIIKNEDPIQWQLDLINGKDTIKAIDNEVCVSILMALPDFPYSKITNKENKVIRSVNRLKACLI